MAIHPQRIRYLHHLLNAIAVVFLVLLIHRAFVDVDLLDFDPLAPYLPFADASGR